MVSPGLGHNLQIAGFPQADIAHMTAGVPGRNQTPSQDSGQIHVKQKFHPAEASSRGTTRSSMAQAA